MCQALASGYRRVYCTAEVEEARALRNALGEGVLGGERQAVRITGFDLGNSPREYLKAAGETLILSTTNGTRAVVSAAARCERVLIASLLNLSAVVAAREGVRSSSSAPASRGRSRSTTRTSSHRRAARVGAHRRGRCRRAPGSDMGRCGGRLPRVEERPQPHGERSGARGGYPLLRPRERPRRCAAARRAARRRRRDRRLRSSRGITRLVESSRAGAGLHST